MISTDKMYQALVKKDSSFEGSFVAGIKTTGIFCRPTCTARKPKKENVEFFETSKDAILNGYRPCKVCKPLEHLGTIPEYIQKLFDQTYKDPFSKITNDQLIKLKIAPSKVRRWFKTHHGITFSGYQRMIRLNAAHHQIANGNSVTEAAFDNGYESLSGFTEAFKNILGENPENAKSVNIINLHRFTTPLGPMIAGATEKGLCLLEFTDRKMLASEFKDLKRLLKATIIWGTNRHLTETVQQIEAYFAGTLKLFDIPLVAPGTDFQKLVWQKLTEIPYGEKRSYKQQAHMIEKPNAIRAVAKANGSNRICIIIPCHRIIGEDGSMTGYSGGIERKKWLLDFEKKNRSNE
jgi:AraC family transcriptional regulator, regulatory protein of adaptative response / methylated-DNA-[protein]-cysteine methyltransferase